jgi:hypothetical protein
MPQPLILPSPHLSRSPADDKRMLTCAVQQLDHPTRQALYAATNNGPLKRGTWSGCPLNRAAAVRCGSVRNQRAAAEAFGLPRHVIYNFIVAWDSLGGTDGACTDLLRDVILAAGIVPHDGGPPQQLAEDTFDKRSDVAVERSVTAALTD